MNERQQKYAKVFDCACAQADSIMGWRVCDALRDAATLDRKAGSKAVRDVIDKLLQAADWLFPYVSDVRPKYKDRAAVVKELDAFRVASDDESATSVVNLAGVVSWMCREVSKRELGAIVRDSPETPGAVVQRGIKN